MGRVTVKHERGGGNGVVTEFAGLVRNTEGDFALHLAVVKVCLVARYLLDAAESWNFHISGEPGWCGKIGCLVPRTDGETDRPHRRLYLSVGTTWCKYAVNTAVTVRNHSSQYVLWPKRVRINMCYVCPLCRIEH
jgi:hypothetical protein